MIAGLAADRLVMQQAVITGSKATDRVIISLPE